MTNGELFDTSIIAQLLSCYDPENVLIGTENKVGDNGGYTEDNQYNNYLLM